MGPPGPWRTRTKHAAGSSSGNESCSIAAEPPGPTASRHAPHARADGSGAQRARVAEALRREADRYRAIADGTSREPPPIELACALAPSDRAAAARANARSMSRLARRVERGGRWAYAAVGTFGFGHPRHGETPLVAWRPGDACPRDPAPDINRFGINVVRAGRAAHGYFGGVAPIVTVSGGAVHSPLNESFLLSYIMTCRLGVPADAVLVDPCADHTHTNVRNTGRLVRALAGRTAYVLTDDGLQSDYLQEWTIFDCIGGSIDQRALRDFGYLIGSWRQASIGIDAGFWFTPYRFWAEPEAALGSFTCVR